jgi:imidazoleglycerol phosphate dehydratase HisB
MLTLLGTHGLFDLTVNAKGDLEVDLHHTNEDIGLVLGQAFDQALGDRKGITRFGLAYVPMDEALARVVLDISGRARAGRALPRRARPPPTRGGMRSISSSRSCGRRRSRSTSIS